MNTLTNQLPESIQSLLDSRELYIRSREQYKNKKIKKQNNTSRSDEDDIAGKVSARPAFGPEAVASKPLAADSVLVPEEVKGESGNVISPRELYIRWSGISVHHVKTKKGVKIGITLQRPDWVSQGRVLQITAELKRYDRLREIKANAEDSAGFVEYLNNIKEHLHRERDKTACLGRAHQRGARKQWIQDTLVLAYVTEDQTISNVLVSVEGEEMVIAMNHTMSDAQARFYHSTGYYGTISLKRRAPRIDELPTTCYGE